MTNTSSSNKNQASSAQLDALNLYDLFNDDPNDSFFEEIDMDLGDISGVFNEGGGDVMTQEFGRGASNAASGIQSSVHQPAVKKRGSKVALTHAQIMANLGIKKDEKTTAASAAPAVEKDEGNIIHRIRTRREARSSEVDAGASKSGTSAAATKRNEVAVQATSEQLGGNVRAAMDSVANYGIRPSTNFYPFMRLPHEVEVKKGQKLFPCLEKVNHALLSGIEKEKYENDSSATSEGRKHNTPLHRILCASYPGSHHELDLEKTIVAAAQAAKACADPSHPMFTSLKEELSKLLISAMKQSAFLRQNLWNIEAYAKQNMSGTEYRDLVTISRNEIEDVLTRVDRNGIRELLPSVNTKNESQPLTAKSSGTSKLIVSVKVKLRVQGWRDKSGRRLVCRMKPPKEWKVASKRAKNLAIKRQEEEAAAIKVVNPAILKAAAAELLQSRKLAQDKQVVTSKIKIASPEKKKTDSADATKKTPSRKRKSATIASASGTESSRTESSTTAELVSTTPFFDIFHIPNYTPQRAILSPAPILSTKVIHDEHSLSHAQQLRLIQVLHTKILHPSLLPTERRTLLANEISSTIQRLESARANKQIAKAQAIQRKIKALEDIYKKDLETVPEVANTVGFWHWLEEAAYFRDIKKEDVYDALDVLPSALPPTAVVEDGKFWGSLPPVKVNVQTVNDDQGTNAVEQSPLFDSLQSLLVEVEGSDDEYDEEELLADLPSFTTEQLLHGPNHDGSSEDEDCLLDVSKLTLDQRTYLQLRAVGLVDTSALPSGPPRLIEAETPPQKRPFCGANNMDEVIQKMKSDLSELETTNYSVAAGLKHSALLHVAQSSKRRKQTQHESIINKYNEFKKEQIQQRDKRRVSGRVKSGPAKFDDDL